MESVANLLNNQLPAYLQGLEIPTSVDDALDMDGRKLLRIAPVFIFLVLQVLLIQMLLCRRSSNRVNNQVKLSEPKVVDKLTAKSGEPTKICRCWKSQTFPLCDGSHVAHNQATGDNVGPALVSC
eukprot:m.270387 g.270387  ORF g.270387 m.270387 type:complete len:125 (+) comp16263_c1_seq1:111-485(+)